LYSRIEVTLSNGTEDPEDPPETGLMGGADLLVKTWDALCSSRAEILPNSSDAAP
jgi:hypothetical protein